MATSSGRVAASKKRHAAKERSEPARHDKPFLRFYHSEGLRRKTIALLDAIEQASDPVERRDELADLVVELTSSGLDYFFMKPLKLAKPGFLIEQSASVGMIAIRQVMGTVIRQIIGRMDGPQLLSVCGSIRQLMR